jgi:hypothetical protein
MTGPEPETIISTSDRSFFSGARRRQLAFWASRIALVLAGSCMAFGLWRILDADAKLLDSPLPCYLAASATALTFVAACLSTGLVIVRRLLPARLRWEERLSIGFALGVMAFQTGVFTLGIFGALNRSGALLLALLLVAAGAKNAVRLVRLLRGPRLAHVKALRPHGLAIGVGAILVAYLVGHALTTDSIGYDASWYHLPLAEAYAASGAIRPFREGWTLGTQPQMASLLYAWAMVVTPQPAISFTSAAFIELSFVAAAVLGVVPLTRMLLGGRERAHWAWACAALFPALLRYPPRIEADYVVAAFAPPLLLAAFKVWEDADRRSLVVGALMLSGLLLVKYSAINTALPPLLLAGAGLLRRLWRARKSGLLSEAVSSAKALGIAGLALLAATSTHWLKNLIFYRDPLFPNYSPPGAFTPVTLASYKAVVQQLWVPAPGWPGWKETLQVLFTFSYEPHEYTEYNAGHAIFGSVFSLTLPALLLLVPFGRARRALVVHVGVLLGVAVWFRVHHQDRYLLALVPWMCAVTATTLAELWQRLPGRLLASAVCALQLAWGLRWGVKFFPMESVRDALWQPSIDAWTERQVGRFRTMRRIASAVDRHAVVMIHDERMRTGLRRTSIIDGLGYQTRLSFAELGSDARVFDRLSQLGVTHLYAPRSTSGFETLGGDLVYNAFVYRYGLPTSEPDLRRMPQLRPPAQAPRDRLVFVDVCGALPIQAGLYRATELIDVNGGMPSALPPAVQPVAGPTDNAALLQRAEFAIIGPGCPSNHWGSKRAAFDLMTSRAGYGLYLARDPKR